MSRLFSDVALIRICLALGLACVLAFGITVALEKETDPVAQTVEEIVLPFVKASTISLFPLARYLHSFT